MRSVAIFGCGPAGLAAAWAAQQSGAEVEIISKKRKSELFGAQYLHQQIPGIEAEQIEVEYRLLGTVAGYRSRVYGSNATHQVSVEQLAGFHKAWDIRKTYEFLYGHFEGRIKEVRGDNLDAGLFEAFLGSRQMAKHTAIINTIPRPSLCLKPNEHRFTSQRIWALGDAPERGQSVPFNCPKDTVLCNGTAPDGGLEWYRLSNIFGYRTVEWPSWFYPGPSMQAAEVKKPIDNTCDCHKNVLMLGRFGKWKKGVLVHHAYQEVVEFLR